MSHPIITAAEAACALGDTLDSSLANWQAGHSGLTLQEGLLAGRIADRKLLKGRRYGAASNLAVQVARRAIAQAGWTEEDTRKSWLFAASSRGNAAELLRTNTWRRPSKRFSASNTLHSEIAAAVSIVLAIPAFIGAVIAERGPLDFLAYLDALDALGRPGVTRELLRSAAETTARAMARVDLLVVLPLTPADDIRVPADEDPALREAMDSSLREFADDPELTAGARVVEIVGAPETRRRLLDAVLD